MDPLLGFRLFYLLCVVMVNISDYLSLLLWLHDVMRAEFCHCMTVFFQMCVIFLMSMVWLINLAENF